MVVIVGEAIVDDVFVELKLDTGIQEYVFNPVAVSVALLPIQIVDDGLVVKLGKGFIVTKTVSLDLQLNALLDVKIYVFVKAVDVVFVCETVGEEDVIELKPKAGDHE